MADERERKIRGEKKNISDLRNQREENLVIRVRVTELGLGLLSSGFSWRWSQPPSFVLFGTVYSYSSQVSFPHPLSRGGCGVAFGGGVSSSSILAA